MFMAGAPPAIRFNAANANVADARLCARPAHAFLKDC
jgi:hypothetical protein